MKTRDIKDALIARLNGLRNLDAVELGYQLDDIVDSLLSSRVSVKQKVSTDRLSPVPAYDAKSDGDYSSWLASNNID